MIEVHWSDGRLPLAEMVELYRLAREEAELRVLERHLAADVRAHGWPPAVLASWDQWAAGRRRELGLRPGGRRPRGIGALDGDGSADSSG